MTMRRSFLRTTAGTGAGVGLGVVPAVSVDCDTRVEDSTYLFDRN